MNLEELQLNLTDEWKMPFLKEEDKTLTFAIVHKGQVAPYEYPSQIFKVSDLKSLMDFHDEILSKVNNSGVTTFFNDVYHEFARLHGEPALSGVYQYHRPMKLMSKGAVMLLTSSLALIQHYSGDEQVYSLHYFGTSITLNHMYEFIQDKCKPDALDMFGIKEMVELVSESEELFHTLILHEGTIEEMRAKGTKLDLKTLDKFAKTPEKL